MVTTGDEQMDSEVNVETPEGEVNTSEQVEQNENNPNENVPEGEVGTEKNEENGEQPSEQTGEKPVAKEEEPDKNETQESKDVKPEDSAHKEAPEGKEKPIEKKTPAGTKEGHLLMPNDSKMKFVQDSFGFSNEKTTFEAPKFHPYLLMKNYSVQYMDPIIKKAKPRRFLCCY